MRKRNRLNEVLKSFFKYRAVLLVQALLVLWTGTYSQQILFRNYSVTDGLVSNTVWSISQDDKGFMWFGTKNGLSKFDGYDFKTFQFDKNIPHSIGNNFIVDIESVNDTTLWVATQDGLYIFDLVSEVFKEFAPTKGQSIYDIIKDKRGNIWIATNSAGVFCYNPSDSKTVNYRVQTNLNSISSNHIRNLAVDKTGRIWMGTFGEGIDVFDPVRKSFINLNEENSGLSSNAVLTLYSDLTGNIWVGTFAGGLNVWQDQKKTFRNYRQSKPNSINDDIVRAIYQPSPDKLYVGTEKGLNILDLTNDRVSTYTKKNNDPFSLSDNAIYSISADRQGGVWVGTFFGGVNFFREKGENFELYYPAGESGSLSGSAVSSFLEDSPGNFWIGTEDGGLNYFNSRDKSFKQFPFHSKQENLSYHNIHTLFKDKGGNIWVGVFAGGLDIYNPKTGKVTNYQHDPTDSTSISNNNVYAIYQDRDQVIWVGTTKGLNIYDPENNSFIRVENKGLQNNIIYDIYEDESKTIWFATYDNGLVGKNKRTGGWMHFKATGQHNTLSSNKVICILDDLSGNLWLGTDGGGLNKLDLSKKTIEVYDRDDGLNGNVIYGILQDDNRNLWISTNNGLYNYLVDQKHFKQYTDSDNLQSKQFNYKAYYKAANGKLYFGGVKGFNAFYPDSIVESALSSNIAFTNFQLFNKDVNPNEENSPLTKPINYTDHITLAHGQSVMSFEYASLNYDSPKKTQYAFMMEGFDDGWNFVGNQRKATYTNLPPGEYTFKVKVLNSNASTEGGNLASIRLTVRPPIYKTIWAYVFYLVMAITSALVFRRYIIYKARNEQQIKLERINTQKEKEFYTQKIEFFTAMAHEIRTPLSLIIAPLERLLHSNKWNADEKRQLNAMDENSDRLLNLVNQLLDFRRMESDIYNIYKEKVELVSFVHSVYSRFSAIPYQKGIQFSMSTKVSMLEVQIDPEAFTKILSNLLINAFKFTRTKVKITINEPFQDNQGSYFFSLCIEDNGIGIPEAELENIFTKFFKVSSGEHHYSNLGGTGIGLALAKSLTEKHGGKLEVFSTENLKTIFKVIIPYSVDEESPVLDSQRNESKQEEDELTEGKTVILVVEDDIPLNEFISQSLVADGYRVLNATNGREGLSILEESQVDLIISDIMMPGMDGIEMCSQVKLNIDFSHIPLILLTARSNSESEIAGIESGADSYIVKPFKWKHLSAVVKNLLESRTALKEKFAQQPFTSGISLTTNNRDKKFIEKVEEIISNRITDPQLSVEELGRELGMSRSNLHKKLKSMSGYVPNEFIRLVRLKHAAKLILSDEYNISEVSYMVGFNSHSYFSKCFVNQFKMPPSEFLEKHKQVTS